MSVNDRANDHRLSAAEFYHAIIILVYSNKKLRPGSLQAIAGHGHAKTWERWLGLITDAVPTQREHAEYAALRRLRPFLVEVLKCRKAAGDSIPPELRTLIE